jgi:UDP-3-O-[3-hydroxymyristoyl] glucosamine N-acyltransferase
LGNGVIMGGRSGTSDNLTLGDGVVVGGVATVFDDVAAGRKVWGTPAIDMQDQMKSVVIFQKLPKLAKELKELTRRIEQLETSKDD